MDYFVCHVTSHLFDNVSMLINTPVNLDTIAQYFSTVLHHRLMKKDIVNNMGQVCNSNDVIFCGILIMITNIYANLSCYFNCWKSLKTTHYFIHVFLRFLLVPHRIHLILMSLI